MSCHGKGRKNRITPLIASTVATLRTWLAERGGTPTDPLFPTRRGRALSRDALEHRLANYVDIATRACPSLQTKRVSAHVLRHTAAMQLLHADVDTSVIALWLGHENVETTQIYLHADLRLKEQAIARTRPPTTKPGRFRPSDSLLAFLESLGLCRPFHRRLSWARDPCRHNPEVGMKCAVPGAQGHAADGGGHHPHRLCPTGCRHRS